VPIVTANEGAGRDLEALGGEGPRPRHHPDWHIVSPLPVEVLRSYYAEAEAATGIPWAYFASIHLVETRLGRIRGTSTAGAQGPMQFIPETWARYGQGDINDNHDAILAAGRLLQANGAPGDISRALFRYNNSERYVDAVQACGGVDVLLTSGGEVVEHRHLVSRGDICVDDVGADETGAAGDENLHPG